MKYLVRIIKNIIGYTTIGTIAVGAAYMLSTVYDDVDQKKEIINLSNSKSVKVQRSNRTPEDYFELLYHVSKTSDDYKMWKKKYDKGNKNNHNTTTEEIIFVLKQIYKNEAGYEARHDSLEQLMVQNK